MKRDLRRSLFDAYMTIDFSLFAILVNHVLGFDSFVFFMLVLKAGSLVILHKIIFGKDAGKTVQT